MSDDYKKHIEIINGSELNKTIDDKHLGKSFKDILLESLDVSKIIDEEIEYIIETNGSTAAELINNTNLIKLVSNNEDASVKIIQLSNIIMKLAVKYTQDIFIKKKNKEVIKEVRELIKEIEKVKNILISLNKDRI